jgi:hypothetical protein
MNKEELLESLYNKYLEYTVMGVNYGLDRIEGYLDNCLVEFDGYYEHFTNPSFQYGYKPHTLEEFINKCKTDTEFSEKWGLKIEERELSLEERSDLKNSSPYLYGKPQNGRLIDERLLDSNKVPTRLITITHKDKTIESYEN